MTAKDLNYVRGTINKEGFESAFVDYSEFQEIQDDEFHALRKKFLEARQGLANFLNLNIG